MKASRSLRISKIKISTERVYIEYEMPRDNDLIDRLTLDSVDPPLPEFRKALLDLRHSICDVCELQDGYDEGLRTTGVSFSYTDDVMGAVITGYKQVEAGGFVINTPHLASRAYGRNAGNQVMPGPMKTRLEDLLDQAIRYINGERAQLEIFEKPSKKTEKAA